MSRGVFEHASLNRFHDVFKPQCRPNLGSIMMLSAAAFMRATAMASAIKLILVGTQRASKTNDYDTAIRNVS